jgi:hypothetical protein
MKKDIFLLNWIEWDEVSSEPEYWACSCGNINPLSSKTCLKCKKER